MAVKTMRDLLVEELREIYDAEKRAVKAYPRLARAASSDRLKQAIEDHLEETQAQIKRIEQVFAEMDLSARGKTCEAVKGFIADTEERLRTDMPAELRDVALITEAQKIEHFEIAAYGSVHTFAQALGLESVATLLKQTLDEEKATDKKLNDIAIKDVNKKALRASEAVAEERKPARRGAGGAAGARAAKSGTAARKGSDAAGSAAKTAKRKSGAPRRATRRGQEAGESTRQRAPAQPASSGSEPSESAMAADKPQREGGENSES
jgi:ferritin-like metal-binding protein YciE